MTLKSSGIYRIVCTKNGRYYYGSAINIIRRWRHHKNRLRSLDHKNLIMQNTWNKYGEDAFQFELVEAVDPDPDLLLLVEQDYLNEHMGRRNCMNIAKNASAPFSGISHTKETRERLSEAHRGKPKPWLQGKKPSPEIIEKRSRALKQAFAKKGGARTGKVNSLEHRMKLSIAAKKQWAEGRGFSQQRGEQS